MRHLKFVALLGSLLLSIGLAGAAELPNLEELQVKMATPPITIPVYEPHLSVNGKNIAIEYVGYPAIDVMATLFGANWRDQAETIEFRALDGYVSRIDVGRFLTESAYLVFAKRDNSPFTVDNIAQNENDVPLAPYYLVWDNVSNPALLAEGARNWPYQVNEVSLVNLSDAALLPDGLDPQFHKGAALAKTHCLSCHQINGFGGEKFDGNLAQIVKSYSKDAFVRLVLDPSAVRPGTTMPPLSGQLSKEEKRKIAEDLYRYLAQVPVLP